MQHPYRGNRLSRKSEVTITHGQAFSHLFVPHLPRAMQNVKREPGDSIFSCDLSDPNALRAGLAIMQKLAQESSSSCKAEPSPTTAADALPPVSATDPLPPGPAADTPPAESAAPHCPGQQALQSVVEGSDQLERKSLLPVGGRASTSAISLPEGVPKPDLSKQDRAKLWARYLRTLQIGPSNRTE